MDDEDLDELILSRLRHRRGQDAARDGSGRIVTAADLAMFFNEPETRIHDRLQALAGQGLVKESGAAPDRWMIVLAGDSLDAAGG
jgi:hypothetical protein